MKQNEIRDVVNQLRDIAKQFFNTEQLRDRIANVLVPILSKSIDEHTREECEKDHGPYNEDAPLHERLRWWVPKSARHGPTTLESDLLEAVEVIRCANNHELSRDAQKWREHVANKGADNV